MRITSQSERILQYSVNFLLLTFLCIFFFQPIETEDSWYHLATGRWIVQNVAVPHVNVFPFASTEVPWIFISWLGSTIYYLVHAGFGIIGLKVFRMIIFVGVLGVFYKYAIKKIPHVLLLPLIIALAYGLAGRLLLRPLVFNFLFLQLFLAVLYANQHGNRKYLWTLPAATIIWFNIHLGCFIYGLPILLIFLGTNVVSLFHLKVNTKSSNTEISTVYHRIKDLMLVILGYFAAFLVNPYGLTGAIYPLSAIFSKEYIDFAFSLTANSENLPPGFILGWEGTWFYIISAAAFVLLILNKKDQLLQWILFVGGFFFFLYGARGSEFFIIVSAYVIAECAGNIALKERWDEFVKKRRVTYTLYLILIFVLALLCCRGLSRHIITENQSKRYLTLDYQPYNAVRAVQFLKDHGIKGRIFNWKMYGGYILWAGYPDLKPFVDSRDIDLVLQHDYANINSNPEQYWPDLEKKYDFNIVMIEADASFQYKFLDFIKDNPLWEFVFIDGSCLIFVKKDTPSIRGKLPNLSQELHNISFLSVPEVNKSLSFPWGIVRRMWSPAPTYNNLFEEGVALYVLGYRNAAMDRLENALQFDHSSQVRFAYDAFGEELRRGK